MISGADSLRNAVRSVFRAPGNCRLTQKLRGGTGLPDRDEGAPCESGTINFPVDKTLIRNVKSMGSHPYYRADEPENGGKPDETVS